MVSDFSMSPLVLMLFKYHSPFYSSHHNVPNVELNIWRTNFLSLAWCSLLSAVCNASILERHRQSYYHYHQGTTDKPSITTNVNIPDNEKPSTDLLGQPADCGRRISSFLNAGGFESCVFPKTSKFADLHLWCVIFILRIQNFETSKNYSLFSASFPFSTQKSRTEVRDFCLHLFCQCNF